MAQQRAPVDYLKMADESLQSKLALTDDERNKIDSDAEKLTQSNLNPEPSSLPSVESLRKPMLSTVVEHSIGDSRPKDDIPELVGEMEDDSELEENDDDPGPKDLDETAGAKPKTSQAEYDELVKRKSRKKGRNQEKVTPVDDNFCYMPGAANAMIMKLDDNVKDILKEGLKGDNRMAWVGPNQYSISEFWQSEERLNEECTPEAIAKIREYWYRDRWNGLVSPPSWVNLDLFRQCILSTETNQEAGSALLIADVNLSMARARQDGDTSKMLSLVRKSDYHIVAPLDTFRMTVRRSEKAIDDSMIVTAAANQAAMDTLIAAESFTDRLRTQVRATVDDTTLSSEHKIDQLLDAVKMLTQKMDVDSGGLKSGKPGHTLAGPGNTVSPHINPKGLLKPPNQSEPETHDIKVETEKQGTSDYDSWFSNFVT